MLAQAPVAIAVAVAPLFREFALHAQIPLSHVPECMVGCAGTHSASVVQGLLP